jgi:hypothetical protein
VQLLVSSVHPEAMISSEEFQQTLQAGKIHQALALLVRDAIELNVTTRLTEDSIANCQTNDSAYIRTKINLLTGEIQNEVGKDVVANTNNYLRLQQLHIDQIVASDRIVQSYLDQIKAILTDLSSTSLSLPLKIESDQLNSDSLVDRLIQAALQPKDQPASAVMPQLSNDPVVIDDNLDLSIDADGEIWEEWVEDEDFSSESIVLPSSSSMGTKSDCEENWVRRQLNLIEVKPHNIPESVNISAQWDKFVPDCISIDPDPQLRIPKSSDVHR